MLPSSEYLYLETGCNGVFCGSVQSFISVSEAPVRLPRYSLWHDFDASRVLKTNQETRI
jgi:hypothetical protein